MKKSLLPQAELVRLLRAKDKQAFDLLYDTYATILYTRIISIVHDSEVAQQVLQESFIEIWQQAPTYDSSKDSLFLWIANITCRTAIEKKNILDKMPQETHHLLNEPTYKDGKQRILLTL